MADKRGLEVLGVTFGLLTALVVMISALVVKSHLDGRLTLDTRQAVSTQVVSAQVVSAQVVSNQVVSNQVVSNQVVSNQVVSTQVVSAPVASIVR